MRLNLHFILTLSFLSFLETAIIKSEGQNVTFQPNITGLQINSYYWTFMQNNQTEEIINVSGEMKKMNRTRFEGRLDTDVKTGSITISNLNLCDSGTFQGFFFRVGRKISHHIVELEVKDGDVNIPVGFNFTLRSTLLKLEEDHVVSWLFGKQFPDREIANNKKRNSHHGDIFDNVILNLTNGDLTIPQVTKSFSGKYYFKIWKRGYPRFSGMYDVSVFDLVSVPNITKSTAPPAHSGCSVTCSVDNGPGVNLTWFRGNANVSCIGNQNVSILTLPLLIQAEDSSTYSCQAQNPVSKQRKTLDSQRLTCHNAGTAKLWVVSIAASLVIIAVAGLFIYRKKWKKGCHVRNPPRSQSNQETSPQNCSSSLTSEEHLLQNVQGSSYETVN